MTGPTEPPRVPTVDEVVRVYVESVLRTCGGSVHTAAPLLGVCPKTVYNWLRRWARNDREGKRE